MKQPITARRPDFGLDKNFDQHWFGGNSILTHLINAMHTVFPVGERQFIKTVKVYESLITKEKLKAEVKAFIGQEIQHGKQHDIFLQTLDRMGLDGTGYAKWYGQAAFRNDEKLSAEAFWIPILKPFFSEGADDRIMLAFTAALEHLTASLAEALPRVWKLVSGVAMGLLPYAKPSFHPNDVEQHELARATLVRLVLSEKKSA